MQKLGVAWVQPELVPISNGAQARTGVWMTIPEGNFTPCQDGYGAFSP